MSKRNKLRFKVSRKPKITRRRFPHGVVAIGLFLIGLAMAGACQCGKDDAPLPGTVFYIPDHQGGPDIMLDTEGKVIGRESRDPWGKRIAGTNEPRGIAGAEYDDEAGLYYMGSRYYDPSIGRFLSVDPEALNDSRTKIAPRFIHGPAEPWTRDPQTINPYSYARNSPARYTDRTGHLPMDGATTDRYVSHGSACDSACSKAYVQTTNKNAMVALSMLGGVWTRMGGPGTDKQIKGYEGAHEFGQGDLGRFVESASQAGFGPLAGSIRQIGAVGRGANRLRPDPMAKGPHTTFEIDPEGRVTKHAEWVPNPKNPIGFDLVKRVDLKGEPHFNKATRQDVPTPHTHDKSIPGEVRPATIDEVPKQ